MGGKHVIRKVRRLLVVGVMVVVGNVFSGGSHGVSDSGGERESN